ncbi:conjugal transfer protein TrbL family protein [Enterococcus sp. BWR-S5]|uniref:conjugal transfer protein TrbL family protein n=1 Tax=Enterococcus sp. BWR-S5 TaxID=2787714 RepID=UPI001923A548|nr:conjugal transfer protein TrbL family protein [Enterococcus sp. BWR-S5]MBL1227209.1 hypothetical protein [Enterococcus sp. BWR-S5]
MLDWLSSIGDFFNYVTNPIDTLMAFLMQLAVEALNWCLGQLINVMKLTDTFAEVKFTQELFLLINYSCGILATAVASYYLFSNVLDIATGGEGEPITKILGKFLSYGYRILAMPFFLFVALELNSGFIKVIQAFGLDSQSIADNLKLSNDDSTAFLKRISSLFSIGENSVLITAFFAVIMAVVFVVLLFQLITRTGDVFFLYMYIPPIAITVFSRDLDMYSTWWRQLISVIGGQSLQLIGIYAGIQFLLEGHGIIGMGILISTIRTPAVMKEFAYNTGGGGIVRQAVSTGSLMLIR